MHQSSSHSPTRKSTTLKLATLATIGLLIFLLLAPGHPDELHPGNWFRLPLDAPIIVGLLLLLRGIYFSTARVLIIIALLALSLLRLGDLISRTAFGRAFSPVAEWHLVSQGWTLTAESIGKAEALGLAGAGLLILMALAYLLYRGLGLLSQPEAAFRKQLLGACAITLTAGIALITAQRTVDTGIQAVWVGGDELVARYNYTRWAVQDQARFTELLKQDELADSNPRFAALQGRDVVILFVESYGRTFIDSPRFKEMAGKRLGEVEAEVTMAGLQVKSGWVNSPIRGGRSWLAHATVASGLPLTNQARFDRLITSEREPLAGLFKQAGWRTAVVLPVVKSDWVEGAWYQVDQFFDRDALGYQGEGFGFVTMPDQYTLSAFESKVRGTSPQPLMAHIGLLDSHAPWGPLPKRQAWDQVGDGSVFDGTQRYGERYSWANPEPVRKAYGMSVDQNLKLVGEYLARFADDGLFIVIGDHQPASVIDGWAPSAEVPIHIFSSHPELLARLPDSIFIDGMTPSPDADNLPMESLRELLATAFEQPIEQTQPAPLLTRE